MISAARFAISDFGPAVAVLLVAERELEGQPLREGRPAVRANHIAPGFEFLQVPADGHPADVEPARQIIDGDLVGRQQFLADRLER